MSFKRVLIFLLLSISFWPEGGAQKMAGVLQKEQGLYPGYVLFSPLNSKHTFLIDECGRVVNEWVSNFYPGNTSYIMPNGNLVRTKRLENSIINGGGGGGGVEIFDWDSNLLWSFEINTSINRLHHDIEPLPNGNILMNVWDVKTKEDALKAGRNPSLIASENTVWSEKIIEVKPIPPSDYEIVWEWKLWDHLIQDFDAEKDNYGIVSDHPELIDINFVPQGLIPNWIHMNAIDFNPALNQIVVSSPFLNEIWVIDHSTTTLEATTHTGGVSGRGGDLLYRWGNPEAYRGGISSDRMLFGQHDVKWISEDYPFESSFILFNNNKGTDYSSIEIITSSLSGNLYLKDDQIYLPLSSNFTFEATPKNNLYSRIMGGIEMLENGNLLICSSLQGMLVEVTMDGDTVWRYKSPLTANGIVGRDYFPPDPSFASDNNFRAKKYSPSFSGFEGKNLNPKEPIEGEPWACEVVTSVTEKSQTVIIYPNPTANLFVVDASSDNVFLDVEIMDVMGRVLGRVSGLNRVSFDLSNYPSGFYIVNSGKIKYKILKR